MANKRETYRVLLLEDNVNDSDLVKIELTANINADLVFKLVNNREDFKAALVDFSPDIIVSDYNLPQFNGFEALAIVSEFDKNIPLIISTGSLTEELAAESIKLGAWDYVVKERLHRLPGAFENSIRIRKERLKALKIQKDLEESQLYIQNLAQVSPVGIFRSDAEGNVTFVNSKLSQLTGLSNEEALGLGWLNAVYSEDREKLINWVNNNLRSAEYRFVNKNGETFWVLANVVPEYKNEILTGYIGAITDITDRKNSELEIIKAKEKAVASDKLKTAFMNNISHEIRTPLNGIIGFSSLLIEPDTSEEDKKSYYEIIENSSKRLIQTVTDYMDISLITSGSVECNNVSFRFNSFLEYIIDKQKPLYDKSDVKLEINIPEEVMNTELTLDREMLYKIFNHLLDNALKFTPEGNVTLSASLSDHKVEFHVKDTGVGISKESLSNIFDHFVQEDTSSSKGYEGSGLGLAIVKGFIEVLGGTVKVESEKGVGSDFILSIPCKSVKVDTVKEKPAANKVNNKPAPLVLVAEDDAFNFFYIKTILKEHFEILHAEDGEQALDIFKNRPDIDLILMDIKMPKVNGLEATKEIRKTNRDIPIIAVTAYAQKGDYEKCIEAGCNDYVSKPIQKEFLFGLIKKLGIKAL